MAKPSLLDLQTSMTPGIRPGQTPHFYELDEYVFQELCRDIFDAESDITSCDVYGARGEPQEGIDLLAYIHNEEGIAVGQCKRYKDFPPREIRKASDEFFKHWEFWSKKGVKRFILFVASDLNNRPRQLEIFKQKERFKTHGITYEAWTAAHIQNKLRSHPGIVSTYLIPPDYWCNIICGSQQPSQSYTGADDSKESVVISSLLANQIKDLSTRISSEIESNLKNMRIASREGRSEEASDWIKSLKKNVTAWSSISSIVKAKLLYFEANLEITTNNDINRAKELANEALTEDPSMGQTRLKAIIAHIDTGPKEAISILNEKNDIDSLNLKAAFLLEMGNTISCRSILDFKNLDIDANAETFRIRSLSYRIDKKIPQSRLEIQKAFELEPKWESIQFNLAAINYFSALSPGALPKLLVAFPDPIPWILIKRDDESIKSLRYAEKVFNKLLQNNNKNKEKQQRYKCWRLACLANDFERQKEAIEYCKITLKNDPTNAYVFIWANARNFEIDLASNELALNEQFQNGTIEIPGILALVSRYLSTQRANIAVQMLSDTKEKFHNLSADQLWTYWYIQSLIHNNNHLSALKIIDNSEVSIELLHLRSIVLRLIADKNKDYQQLIQHLENSYKKTGDANFLFDSCELAAQQMDWDYIADRAEKLIHKLSTSEAVRLVAIGSYNSNRFGFCLNILDNYVNLFRHQKLPNKLRRMRSLCQEALGILPGAICEAEALAQEDPTTENILNLAQLYFQKGDLKSLSFIARKLLNQPDLPVKQALSIAKCVQWEDQDLAISLWKKVQQCGFPDNMLGDALILGFQLGIDKDLGPIHQRMQSLIQEGQGGIQVASIEDLINFAETRKKQIEKLEKAYNDGVAPIHVILEQLNTTLANLYHRSLSENETSPDPIKQFSLFVRHGGHTLVSGIPEIKPEWRLNIDITSIILAAHLGIISDIEKVFKPLRISRFIIPALIQMRDMVTHKQPSRLHAYEKIIKLKEKSFIRVVDPYLSSTSDNMGLIDVLGEDWVALFENARSNDGYIIDFLPLRNKHSIDKTLEVPEGICKYLVNFRAIIETLYKEKVISKSEYNNAIKELGSEGLAKPSEAIPRKGSPLYFHINTIKVFGVANLLHIICEHFHVHIEQQEYEHIAAELEENNQQIKLAKWLDKLIKNLRKGIDDGVYVIIPFAEGDDFTQEEDPKYSLDLKCLMDLLRFEPKEGDVIWFDDRYTNSFLSRDNIPIIGINEVLKALVSDGIFELRDYYDKISRLRASNVLYIPLQKDEILYQLRQSEVQNGVVVETLALKVLRRHIASCLFRKEPLQLPIRQGYSQDEKTEVAFLVSLSRAITDSIVGIWDFDDDETTREAYSDWIMSNLYIDHPGLFEVTSFSKAEKDDLYLYAVSLSGLVSQAITLRSESEDARSHSRNIYFKWLYDKIFKKRFEVDKRLLPAVADALKKSLFSAQEKSAEYEHDFAVKNLLQNFYEDLPTPIRNELSQDIEFMSRIGFTLRPIINLYDLVFESKQFWCAVKETVNGRQAEIVTIDDNKKITFSPSKNQNRIISFCFKHPVTKEKKIVTDELFRLLSDSITKREAVLKDNGHWFDCSENSLDRITAEIISISDPKRRIEEGMKWRDSSLAVHFSKLDRKLRSGQQIRLKEFMPPDADGLLRFFRFKSKIETSLSFQDLFSDAFHKLINEEGIISSLERLAGLPTPFPKIWMEIIAEYSDEEKKAFIKDLLKYVGSPVSKIHLLHILSHISPKFSAFGRLAHYITNTLFTSEGVKEFDAFHAVLKWTNIQFNQWHDTYDWDPLVRLSLSWAYAHHIFSKFLSSRAPFDAIIKSFNQENQVLPDMLFDRDNYSWKELCHPNRINRVVFLLSGLSYALDDKGKGIIGQDQNNLIIEEVFRDEGGIRLPTLPFMRDPTQAQNEINSFLGGDRGEKFIQLLGAENANYLSQDTFIDVLENEIKKWEETHDPFTIWIIIQAMFLDLPLYDNVANKLPTIILQTDFAYLVEKERNIGLLAILTASLQVTYIDDNQTVRDHLKDQVLKIAKILSSQDTVAGKANTFDEIEVNQQNTSDLMLLEVAVNIALAVKTKETIISEFVKIVIQLIEEVPSLVSSYMPIIKRLCEGLSISKSKAIWPLLVRLRAE